MVPFGGSISNERQQTPFLNAQTRMAPSMLVWLTCLPMIHIGMYPAETTRLA